jgi:hypothetical protein
MSPELSWADLTMHALLCISKLVMKEIRRSQIMPRAVFDIICGFSDFLTELEIPREIPTDIRAKLEIRNVWVCRFSLTAENFPEMNGNGLVLQREDGKNMVVDEKYKWLEEVYVMP